jgi:hypothetical protein
VRANVAYKLLAGKPVGKVSPEIPTHRRKDGMKVDLKEGI